MIMDNIKNLDAYNELSSILGMRELIDRRDFLNKQDGKYTLNANQETYYLVQHYKTLPAELCVFEAHKKYVDIHLILEGEEGVGHHIGSENLKIKQVYDPSNDVETYNSEKIGSYLHLTKNTFAVFFPQDAHMPKLQSNGASDVFKIVLKIPKRLFALAGID